MMKTVLRCTVVYVVTEKKSCYAVRQDVVGEYLYDEDGAQMYCCICSDGEEVMLCDTSGCCR